MWQNIKRIAKMTILIINHYAGSPEMGMEYRPYFLALELMKMGHKVVIVSSSFSHVRQNQKKLKKRIQFDTIDNIDYIWIKTPAYSGNGIKRILNILTFVLTLWLKANSLTKKLNLDVVIASSTYPFDIFPSRKIATMSKAKLIFEVHDLWPLSPIELGGMSRNSPYILAVQFGEDYAYKHCDEVISLLPNAKDYMISHGLDSTKFHYIPNGINIDEWSKREKIPKEIDELIVKSKNEGKKLVCYAGSHGIANSLETLINVAKYLEHENVTFILVGDGPEKSRLENLVLDKKINNVIFFSPIKKQQIPELLSKMDILYIGLQRQSLFRFGISPNKIFDYMLAGKPIVQAIEAGNDIVKDAKCGISVRPEDPVAIGNAIRDLLSRDEHELIKIGSNGKDYILKNHLYSQLAIRLVSILNKF